MRPAGAARSPARNARQASKSARVRSAIGPALRMSSKASSTYCSPAQAMPTSCWQTTSSGARIMRQRLDPAGPGGARRDDRAGQLGGRRREQEPARARAAAMPRPTDPLHAPRHAARQPDLDRQVGRADVDAQLEARAGDDRPQLARPQRRLDLAPPGRVERRSDARRQSAVRRRGSARAAGRA